MNDFLNPFMQFCSTRIRHVPSPRFVSLVLVFLFARPVGAVEISIGKTTFPSRFESTMVKLAVEHFQVRFRLLQAEHAPESDEQSSIISLFLDETPDPALATFQDFQKRETYLIEATQSDGNFAIHSTTELGLVYGLSDLETRLRVYRGRVTLSFPEWNGSSALRIVEKPAIATRGEYLNIGYDVPGITPHQWKSSDWQRYIDGLILARLNRLYLFLWIDSQSMFEESKLSTREINRHLHEGVRDAIRYAHRRGLTVTLMVSPTMLPKDIWDAHPDWKADIVYAREGFACACPSIPEAWQMMRAVWRSELAWFREVDSIQVWFYDPGGCWCETHGCKAHQAESLTRQVREFADMFHELNPNGRIEYNLWPVTLWEAEMKVKVRDDLAHRLAAEFENSPNRLTAVGTAEGSPAPVPDLERSLKMNGDVFLFATNPESGYVFPTPLTRYVRETIQTVKRHRLDGCFGHRLEAGTRYVGTFLMGLWMWNPDLSIDEVLRRYADWQTGSANSGAKFANALLTLDELTTKGLRSGLGKTFESQVNELWQEIPIACQDELEYWPAIAQSMRILSDSQDAADQDLPAFAKRFEEAFRSSKTLAPLVPQSGEFFSRYRKFLLKGWDLEHF